MEFAIPSQAEIEVMRSIARAGFDYQDSKRLCSAAGWRLVEDEPELGFLQYQPVFSGKGRLFSVCFRGSPQCPFAFTALCNFEDYSADRTPFDQAFARVADHLKSLLKEPSQIGSYYYSHRPKWSYAFSWWSLDDASLALVQDEYDIQFGMDVSVWILPAGLDVRIPILAGN